MIHSDTSAKNVVFFWLIVTIIQFPVSVSLSSILDIFCIFNAELPQTKLVHSEVISV